MVIRGILSMSLEFDFRLYFYQIYLNQELILSSLCIENIILRSNNFIQDDRNFMLQNKMYI